MAVFKFRNLKNGQATPIPPGEFTIGRADDAYIHLEDGSISRRHAQVINNAAGFFIEDLGSANGTAAHGVYITRRMSINYGDVVYIGSVPFRIDPEVEGEVDAAPSAGLRTSNRAYIRRDTERLPANVLSSAPPSVMEEILPDKLSAPEVNADTNIDAGDLNAITMREPEDVAEQVHENHEAKPVATKEILAEIVPIRSSFSVPVPVRSTSSQQPSRPVPVQPTPMPPAPASAQAASVETVKSQGGRGWLLMTFLAGMGAGLLIGLYFAKLFIEMGGKPTSLP